jgi:hypothetical protein
MDIHLPLGDINDEHGGSRAAVVRWLEQAVIGLNLCPFAKAVQVKGLVRLSISQANDPDSILAALETELQHLASTAATVTDTTLLVLPRAFPDFLDFHLFQGEVAALLRRLDFGGIFQVAPFHPRWEFAGSAPDDVENCVGRAPYPVLHVLREASVDRAVAAFPEAARIYEANRIRLRALGWEGWNALCAEDASSKD